MIRSICILIISALLLVPSLGFTATKDWTTVLDQAESSLQTKTEAVSSLEKNLPGDIQKLRKEHLILAANLELLLWSRDTNYNNPLDLNDVVLSLDDFLDKIKDIAAPYRLKSAALDMHSRELSAQAGRLESADAWIQNLSSPEASAQAARLRDGAASLNKRIEALRARLDSALKTVNRFEKRVTDTRASFAARYLPAMHNYYLVPSSDATSLPAAQRVINETVHWIKTLSFTNMGADTMSVSDWIMLIVLGLAAAGGIMWVVRFGLMKLDTGSDDGFNAETSNRSGAWIGLGLALLAAVSTLNISPSSFFRAVAVILVARGLITLTSSLRRDRHNHPASPLFLNAWRIIAAGDILQGLLLPEAPLSLVMAVLLAAGGLWYMRRTRLESGLEKGLAAVMCWTMFLFAVISLMGWGNLGVDGPGLIFLICLNILVCARLMAAIRKCNRENASFAVKTVAAFSFPVLLVVLSMGVAVLSLAPLGGYPLFQALITLQVGAGKNIFTIDRILAVIALFFVTRSLIDFTKACMARNKDGQVTKGAAASVQTLVTYGFWAAYILLALRIAGVPSGSLAVVAGGLSVGVGFGMKNVVSNFISGLILLFDRSVVPGDVLDVGKEIGRVERVTIRNTTIRTYTGKTVVVPNSNLVSNIFVNWSHKDPKFRMAVTVGVACGTDTEKAAELLLKIADAHPAVLKQPAPQVRFQDFGPSTLDLELRFWIPDDNHMYIPSDLRHAVNKAFEEHEIEMPFPQMDLYLKSMPQGHKADG